MRLLLDTHSLLWWLQGDPRLSSPAMSAIGGARSDVHISAATAWEIATKVRLGKMPQMADVIGNYEADVAAEGFHVLVIEQHHSLRAGLLPGSHGDPFDRIIAAQALIEELTVVTRNREIANFGCEVLW